MRNISDSFVKTKSLLKISNIGFFDSYSHYFN